MNQIRFALQRPSKVLPILMIVAFMLAFLAPRWRPKKNRLKVAGSFMWRPTCGQLPWTAM